MCLGYNEDFTKSKFIPTKVSDITKNYYPVVDGK
jgi:hypothetical protein